MALHRQSTSVAFETSKKSVTRERNVYSQHDVNVWWQVLS